MCSSTLTLVINCIYFFPTTTFKTHNLSINQLYKETTHFTFLIPSRQSAFTLKIHTHPYLLLFFTIYNVSLVPWVFSTPSHQPFSHLDTNFHLPSSSLRIWHPLHKCIYPFPSYHILNYILYI